MFCGKSRVGYLIQPRNLFTTLMIPNSSDNAVVVCLARDSVCPLPGACIGRELDIASGRPWTDQVGTISVLGCEDSGLMNTKATRPMRIPTFNGRRVQWTSICYGLRAYLGSESSVDPILWFCEVRI